MSTTIEDRLILLLLSAGEPYGFWQGLEKLTGISAQRWRGVYARRQRPTSDMISAICKLQPQYAFWLATGITDALNGHTAPPTALTFPEMPRSKLNDPFAENYFHLAIQLNEDLHRAAGLEGAAEDVRYIAYELTHVGNSWWATGVAKDAYDIAAQKRYAELMEAHNQREQHRLNKTKPPKKPKHPDLADKLAMPDPRTAHQMENDLFWRPKDFSNDGDKED